ncbi:MAG TPA: phosphopantetheine-binding protein, partial [Steroidobacter sp.]|nr:phosphopantetheine-binding protein [Steroidobacter sp.]
VKIRGFRIELGEIEAALYAQPEVRDAAVTVHEGPGGGHLVGYVVPAADEWLMPAIASFGSQWLEQDRCERLQRALRERLPEYMVPSHWLLLERLPLNANGKVDRKALPAPAFGRLMSTYVAPRSELERTLADIWRDVLAAERVGVNDDFFQLGGHSLLATQIVSRAQFVLQRSVPLRAMFECRTVQELAEYIESLQGEVVTEHKASRLDELMTRLEMS